MGERRFPIQDGPSVPWRMIEPYEAALQANHSQDLETLAMRGGLCPGELRDAVQNRDRMAAQSPVLDRAWLEEWLYEDAADAALMRMVVKLRDSAKALGPFEVVVDGLRWAVRSGSSYVVVASDMGPETAQALADLMNACDQRRGA